MKKRVLSFFIAALALPIAIGGVSLANSLPEKEVSAGSNYSAGVLPTNINLNDTTDSAIRSYYSALNGRNLNGNSLLAALKPILATGQQHFSYDVSNGANIWKAYEITDRDWTLSPASGTTYGTYDSTTNTIKNYVYGSTSNRKNDPYVHPLYRNRGESEGYTHAFDAHGGNNGNGIDREHVWPKSRGFENAETGSYGARGDLHHLMAGDHYVNSTSHNNYSYGNVRRNAIDNDAGSYQSYIENNYRGTSSTLGSGTVFEPQDCDKGDIARACFYMVARYNNIAGNDDTIDSGNPNLTLNNSVDRTTIDSTASTPVSLGVLTDLLAWNELDPPDEYEIHRNNLIYNNFSYNRNPFIDFPSWANIIWGGTVGYASPSTNAINTFGPDGDAPVETIPTSITLSASSLSLFEGETSLVSVASVTPDGASNSVTWSSNDEDVATVSSSGLVTAVSKGSATITATSTLSASIKATISVTVDSKTEETTDVINYTFTGLPTSGNTYTSWTKVGPTGASYSGKSCTNDDNYVQLRTKNGDEGIVSTVSGGRALSVSVEWNSSTSNGRSLSIYGKDSAYESPSDLYSDETKGTWLGRVTKGTSTEIDLTGGYPYIGLRSDADAIYLDSITITYGKPVESVSLNETSLDLVVGDTVALVAEILPLNATDQSVTWVSSDSGVATVDSEGLVTAVAQGSATITVTTHDGSFTATCAIAVFESGDDEESEIVIEEINYFHYKKVTNVSDLKVGDMVVIANETGTVSLSTTQTDNNRSQVASDCTDGVITLDAETTVQVLVLGKDGDDWTFDTGSGYLYAASSSKNYLRTQADLDDNGTWSISITDGKAAIEAQGDSSHNILRYNSGSKIFSCYTTGQQDVSIFKSYEYEADRYGEAFLNTYTSGCHSDGIGSTVNWSGASSAYSILTSDAQDILTGVTANEAGSYSARAAARYDYIVGKYGTGTYADFMGRNPEPLSGSLAIKKEEFQVENLSFVFLMLGGFLSVTVFVLLRRKKND